MARYFSDRVHRPDEATISIAGERYVLLRAASMSVEFVELVMSLFADREPAEARSVANNLLFDLAHAIGKADARSFHEKMGVADPIERLSAGPIHFAFSGWASVRDPARLAPVGRRRLPAASSTIRSPSSRTPGWRGTATATPRSAS